MSVNFKFPIDVTMTNKITWTCSICEAQVEGMYPGNVAICGDCIKALKLLILEKRGMI